MINIVIFHLCLIKWHNVHMRNKFFFETNNQKYIITDRKQIYKECMKKYQKKKSINRRRENFTYKIHVKEIFLSNRQIVAQNRKMLFIKLFYDPFSGNISVKKFKICCLQKIKRCNTYKNHSNIFFKFNEKNLFSSD